MAESEGGGRKWLTCGCLGCLAIVAIVVAAVLGVFGTAWVGAKSERVAERVLEPAIPAAELATAEQSGKPGRVVLRLKAGEFVVKPAAKGESLYVEATYDENTYDLRERFDPGEDGWVYEVDFERRGGTLMGMLKGLFGTDSRVDVYLPTDVPLELEVDFEQGASAMDLGGLWLTESDIEFGQGAFQLEISEPLHEPMESLAIRGTMGAFIASEVGNASPRRLDVDFSMGGMQLDLRGGWVTDSEITIRTSQGGGQVRLPRDVEIVGLETSRVGVRDAEETPRPTLTFTVSSSQGELEIVE
jgi:hypothetical protein